MKGIEDPDAMMNVRFPPVADTNNGDIHVEQAEIIETNVVVTTELVVDMSAAGE